MPNLRDIEKQVVKRLDMTLKPYLWVIYLLNHPDQAFIV